MAKFESLHCIQHSEEPQELCTVEPEIVKVRVAIDSAACDNVINPEELPSDAEFEPNETGKHFNLPQGFFDALNGAR